MTRRERLRRCFYHEELDRPGVFCRTGFPDGDPTYDRLKAYLAAHTELKRPWHGLTEVPPPTEQRTEAVSPDWERRITTVHTPAGDLQGTTLVSLRGRPGLAETYLLSSREDAEKYLSLPLPQLAGDVSSFSEAEAEVGERGIVDVALGFNPGGFAAELFGSSNFALMSVTDRDVLHALCERRMNVILRKLKFLLEHGVGPYFSMAGEEYITPPLHGPQDFYDFNVRYDRPIIDLVHEAGGRMHIHCHGSIRRVFQGFLDMGVDVLHPFEAPPMGDITAAEAKALARGRICLEGNIQISRMYEATPDQVREETRELIEVAFDDRRGLIVCPTASPYIRGAGEACFPRFQAMVEAVLACGA